jgi:hypothetical protein
MFENVHLLCQMESILQRTINKNSYNKKKIIEKIIDDMNILTTLIKHLYF